MIRRRHRAAMFCAGFSMFLVALAACVGDPPTAVLPRPDGSLTDDDATTPSQREDGAVAANDSASPIDASNDDVADAGQHNDVDQTPIDSGAPGVFLNALFTRATSFAIKAVPNASGEVLVAAVIANDGSPLSFGEVQLKPDGGTAWTHGLFRARIDKDFNFVWMAFDSTIPADLRIDAMTADAYGGGHFVFTSTAPDFFGQQPTVLGAGSSARSIIIQFRGDDGSFQISSQFDFIAQGGLSPEVRITAFRIRDDNMGFTPCPNLISGYFRGTLRYYGNDGNEHAITATGTSPEPGKSGSAGFVSCHQGSTMHWIRVFDGDGDDSIQSVELSKTEMAIAGTSTSASITDKTEIYNPPNGTNPVAMPPLSKKAASGDAFVAKFSFNPESAPIFATRLATNNGSAVNVSARGVGLSSLGDVVVCGEMSGMNIAFGPDASVSSQGARDGYVALLNGTDGAMKWLRTWGGSNDDRCDNLALDKVDQIVVGGTHTSANVMGFAGLTLPPATSSTIDAFGLSIDGNVLWSISSSGSGSATGVDGIITLSGRRMYRSGSFTGAINFGIDAGVTSPVQAGFVTGHTL